MTPDDKHGTNAGYFYGCRLECCRTAHAAYRRSLWRKRYVRRVDRLYVDATGTSRRIRALQAMGYRFIDIDRALGRNPKGQGASLTHNIITQERVHVDTARQVAEVYERLSMTFGPSKLGRTRALAKGWAPPLAWDDIDTDPEPAATTKVRMTPDDYDEAMVQRIFNGGTKPRRLTRAETIEVVRRLLASGLSTRQIADRYGIKVERFYRVGDDAA